jgi:uncharacterized protein (TIGR02145 family)
MMKIDRFVFLILTPLMLASAASYVAPEGTTASKSPGTGIGASGIIEKGSVQNPQLAKSIRIGSQEWTTENLDVSKFRNGDLIPQANSEEAWEKACIEGTPAWCYYNNDPVKYKSYGKLYNFWAVLDKRMLAPEGWHIPTDAEWATLTETLGGIESAGKSMKSTKGWKLSGNGDNKSGFNGLAGGYRSHEKSGYYGGPFFELGAGGYWWSTTGYLVDNSYCRVLSYKNDRLEKSSFVKTAGLSVRLIKD